MNNLSHQFPTTDTAAISPLPARARLAARRLRAAARRGNPYTTGRRAAEIGRYLAHARRTAPIAVVTGPYWQVSSLAAFLREWGAAIDAECRWSARA